ncbi:MAG: sel1 repeat family protein, partial [Lachnospiraceae bacterium]|nr:sel1 repeat family protein [Lachnospiraceae bacterium]
MGKCFSDAVEEALRYIYYDVRLGKGAEGLELLKKASKEGDGDASCILARCMWGPQYVWRGHNFPVDEELGMKYLYQSVEQGSALGVMVAVRCDEFSQEMEQKMPYSSLKEVFNKVLEKANAGDAFCQYTIGNSYFWGDFIDIEGINLKSFSSNEELKAYVTENTQKCEEWFWKALKGGIHFAVNNLKSYYTKGVDGYVEPQPSKAKDLYKIGAELGHPYWQWSYAEE